MNDNENLNNFQEKCNDEESLFEIIRQSRS